RRALQQLELTVLRLASQRFRAQVASELGLDVAQERGGRKPAQRPTPMALLGAAPNKSILCARHADIEQAPFLLQCVVVLAPAQRKDAVLEPSDEHHRKFETLRGMQREQ